ncbi:MAG: amidinotransferase, partial [Chloroflexota bacterium]|nr:amidinotransferase [Chloroflexota bacterium]
MQPNPSDADLRNTEAYYHVVLERIPPRAEPAFESAQMQQRVWGREWGVSNDVGRLRLCVVHRPEDEIATIDASQYDADLDALINDRQQWYWRDRVGPDLKRMQREHDALVAALRNEGVNIECVGGSPGDPKAVFTRDQAIAVKGGAIICRM